MTQLAVKAIVRVHFNESIGITKLSERFELHFCMPGPPQIGLDISINTKGDSINVQEVVFDPFAHHIQYTVYSTWETLSEEEFHSVCEQFSAFWEKEGK